MSKHTSEPWPHFIEWCEPATPHPDSDGFVGLGFEDYQRARACVNACASLPTEGLENNGLLATAALLSSQCDELRAVIKELEFQASKVGNIAFNLGQSHKQWPDIENTYYELHAVRMKALDLCS